jgi:hypothetical protein
VLSIPRLSWGFVLKKKENEKENKTKLKYDLKNKSATTLLKHACLYYSIYSETCKYQFSK